MAQKSDFELLAEAKKLDLNALGLIYDRYSMALYQYAYRQTGNQQMAEDCVAETFSRFLHVLKQNKGPREFMRPYLYRIAHNWISDQYRKPAPHDGLEEELELVEEDQISVEGQILHHETSEILREQLMRLNPDQRQVIVLKYLEGMNNSEAAEIMGRNVGSIKALNSRALSNLRKLILKDEQVTL